MIDSTVVRAHHPLPGRALRTQCPEAGGAGAKGGLRDRVSTVRWENVHWWTTSRRPRSTSSSMQGCPRMRTEITPGQTSDYLGFDLVMADNLPNRASCWPTEAMTLTAFENHGSAGCLAHCPRANHAKCASESTAPLPTAQPRRAVLQQAQERTPGRHPLRQDRGKLPGFIDITSIRLWLRHLST
jgi:hypothetical protein